MRLAKLGVAGVAAAVLLGGCVTSPDRPPSPSPSVPVAHSPGQSSSPPSAAPSDDALRNAAGEEVVFPVVEIAEVRPETIKITEIAKVAPPPLDQDQVGVLALEGKETLVWFLPVENYSGEGMIKSGGIGFRTDDGELSLFDSTEHVASDGRPRGIIGADLDDDWAVWSESSSTDLYQSNWRVFSQRRGGGAPRLLAVAEDQRSANWETSPIVSGDSLPILSAGLVWWHTARERPDGIFRPRVVAVPPDGGDVKVMLDMASTPTPVTGGVVATQVVDDPGVPVDERAYAYHETGLVLIDASGAVTDLLRYSEDVDAGRLARNVASDGDTVAFVMGDDVLVMRIDGTPVARIPGPAPEGREFTDLAVCDGKVLFTPYNADIGGDTVVIYDSVSGALKTIDAPDAFPWVYCSDERVGWTQAPDGWGIVTIAEMVTG